MMVVLEQAAELSLQRRRGVVEALAKSIAGLTASAILKGLKRMFGKGKKKG